MNIVNKQTPHNKQGLILFFFLNTHVMLRDYNVGRTTEVPLKMLLDEGQEKALVSYPQCLLLSFFLKYDVTNSLHTEAKLSKRWKPRGSGTLLKSLIIRVGYKTTLGILCRKHGYFQISTVDINHFWMTKVVSYTLGELSGPTWLHKYSASLHIASCHISWMGIIPHEGWLIL